MKKQKCLNLGLKVSFWVLLTKNALFEYFWARTNLSISGQELHEKRKMPKFGLEFEHNYLGIFDKKILKTLLSYLKSAPSNSLISKCSRKNKNV